MITIDLSGPQGNAFWLLGYAEKLAKQLSWDQQSIDDMIEEMKSGDYDDLCSVFSQNFCDYVELVG